MAKKKSLFTLIWRFFVSDTKSNSEKEKRKKWFFRKMKMKRLAPLSAPPRETLVCDAEQSNCDAPVIVAVDYTTEIENYTARIGSVHQREKSLEPSGINVNRDGDSETLHQREREIEDLAAIRIQAVFRGFLARKALRALRGVVKLQALIRGWAVRQQALNTLKCLQSIVSIQSEICSKRCERSSTDHGSHFQDYTRDFKEKDIKVDLNSQKRWDDSTRLTKEESKAIFLSKKEASVKRERIKEYYLHHRRSAETERDKAYGRRRYWLEQWVDAQLAKRDYQTNSDKTLSHNARNYKDEQSDSPAYVAKRTSFHRKQRSVGDDSSFPLSPGVPTYMAATESAKAKARSLSSPRLRPINIDVCSEIASPYKHRLSPISSINSELTSGSWIGNAVGFSQRSPRLRGLSGPVKSSVSVKEIRLQGIQCQNGVGVADTDYLGK